MLGMNLANRHANDMEHAFRARPNMEADHVSDYFIHRPRPRDSSSVSKMAIETICGGIPSE